MAILSITIRRVARDDLSGCCPSGRFRCRWGRLASPVILVGLLTILSGCQANPFGLSHEVYNIRWAQQELDRWEAKVVGQTVADADHFLGVRNDTLEPLDDGQLLIIYPTPSNPKGEFFLVGGVSADGRITDVSVWMRNRDGLLDIWRVKQALKSCFPLSQAECEKAEGLGPWHRNFHSVNTGFRAVSYQIGGVVPGQLPKYLILCFDADDLCVDVRCAGVLARGKLRVERDDHEAAQADARR